MLTRTLVLVCVLFFSCKKELLNIYLKDKSLETIKQNIAGHWQIKKVIDHQAQDVELNNSYVDFLANDKTFWQLEGVAILDGTIQWVRAKNIGGDSTYLMLRFDNTGNLFPPTLGVEEIKDGKLLIYENSTSGIGYELKR